MDEGLHDFVFIEDEVFFHTDGWGSCLCTCEDCRDDQGICICDECIECTAGSSPDA